MKWNAAGLQQDSLASSRKSWCRWWVVSGSVGLYLWSEICWFKPQPCQSRPWSNPQNQRGHMFIYPGLCLAPPKLWRVRWGRQRRASEVLWQIKEFIWGGGCPFIPLPHEDESRNVHSSIPSLASVSLYCLLNLVAILLSQSYSVVTAFLGLLNLCYNHCYYYCR